MKYVPAVMLAIILLAANAAVAIDRDWRPNTDSAVRTAAETIYGTSTLTIYDATDSLFSAIFPNHPLKLVYEQGGPQTFPHLMAYKPLTQTGFDLSKNFSALMIDNGTVLSTASDAVNVGSLYARMANSELQFERVIAFAANSSELNHVVSDPAATAVLGGWQVKLSTWAYDGGHVANWTMNFTVAGISSAEWRIVASARGGFVSDPEAMVLSTGMRFSGTYSTTYTLSAFNTTAPIILPWNQLSLTMTWLAEARAFDNTIWRAYYATPPGESAPTSVVTWAESLVRGGADGYNRTVKQNIRDLDNCDTGQQHNFSLNYSVNDSDCVIKIIVAGPVSCGACTNPEITKDSVEMIISASVRAELLVNGGYYPNPAACDDTCLGRAIATHEFFHHLQWVLAPEIYKNRPEWDTPKEGIARVVDTLVWKDSQQTANSTWYRDIWKGRNTTYSPPPGRFMRDWTQDDFCDIIHTSAGYWGMLYQSNGGLGTLNDIMQAIAPRKDLPCNIGLPGAVDSVLANATGDHDTFNASLVEYTIRLYQKTFSWGDPFNGNQTEDWGQHLQHTTVIEHSSGTLTKRTPAYSFHHVKLPTSGTYTVDCGSNSGWTHKIMNRTGASWQSATTLTCGTGASINGASWDEVILVMVRTFPTTQDGVVTIS